MSDSAEEWLQAAQDDINAVIQLLNDPRLTNIASFHVQQAVEKCFKAVLEKNDIQLIKSHNLERLYENVKDFIHVPDEDLLQVINELYIDSRYPGDAGLMPDGKPAVDDVNEFLEFAREVYNRAAAYIKEP